MENTLFKYAESDNNTILIALQINDGKPWSEIPASFHRIPGPNGAIYAQFLANALQAPIRLTQPKSTYEDVSRCNGAYIYPGNRQMIITEHSQIRPEILIELSEGHLQHACKTGPDVDLYIMDWDKAEAKDATDDEKTPSLWRPLTMSADQFKTYRTNILNQYR